MLTAVSDSMLFHLIYVSTAISPRTLEDHARLLSKSRARNKKLGLTGMLLYRDGYFMQVLEGEENDVMAVFADIKKDIRHHSIDVLRSEYIQHRDFPDWTMGFTDVGELDTEGVPGFTRFLEHDFNPEYFAENSVEAHAMLVAFRDS